jgi:hypothetical protein
MARQHVAIHAAGTNAGVISIPKPDAIGLQTTDFALVGRAHQILVQRCSDEIPEIVAGASVILLGGEGHVARRRAQNEDFGILIHDLRKSRLSHGFTPFEHAVAARGCQSVVANRRTFSGSSRMLGGAATTLSGFPMDDRDSNSQAADAVAA